MADQKISQLNNIAGANVAADDEMVIVDTDAGETKAIRVDEARIAIVDATSVTAAGAVMDSELTSEASVKAINQGLATTDSPSFAGLTTTGDITIPDKIIHAGDTNTAIRFPAADTVAVETSGTERLRIDTSGKLLSAGGSAFVGTVATGATNGAIIERGSNANGEYVKYADGTMICTQNDDLVYVDAITIRKSWTFPASFVATPQTISGFPNLNSFFSNCTPSFDMAGPVFHDSPSSSSTSIVQTRINGLTNFVSGDFCDCRFLAIGRWY